MADRFYRIGAAFTVRGKPMRTGFAVFGDESGLPSIDPTSVAARVDAALSTTFAGLLTTVDTLDSWLVRDEPSGDPAFVPSEAVFAVNRAGARSVGRDDLVNALCAEMHIATDAAVRSGHGWMFLPPARGSGDLQSPPAWNTTTGYWIAIQAFLAQLNHLKTGGSFWSVGEQANNWGVGVYSLTRRKRGLANFAFHATAISAKTSVKYLRSRNP